MNIQRRLQLRKAIKKRATRLRGHREVLEIKRKIAERKEQERIAKLPQTIARLRSLPAIELTKEQFANIPKAGSFTTSWLQKDAPIDFQFICKSFPECPKDLTILGHLVKGDDALCSQWGAGLCPPEKFINRYRVVLVA